MTNIQTYKELLEEKQRLTLLLEQRKLGIKTEFESIKEKLSPVKEAFETIHKFTTKDKSNPLLTAGIDLGVNLVLKNFILRNAGFLVRLVTPYLVKNFLSHEATEKDNLFSKIGDKVGDLFTSIKKKFTQHQPA